MSMRAKTPTPFRDELSSWPKTLMDLFAGVALHPLGQLIARYGFDQSWVVATVDEPDWGSRHAEPELDLRAHRHPLEPPADHIREIAIVLVTAVVAHLDAEQAGRNAEADRLALAPSVRQQLRGLTTAHGAMMTWIEHSTRPSHECYS